MSQKLISGDQSVLWDTVLKLKVLTSLGYSIVHAVHTADLFSRPPQGSKRPQVTKEAFLRSGNVNRWTACLEAAPWLGRMPISPVCLQENHGINFEAVLRGQPKSSLKLDNIVADLTQGDWLGLSHPNSSQVAHTVPMGDILPVFHNVRRPLRKDVAVKLGQNAIPVFDLLFKLTEYQHQTWHQAMTTHLSDILSRFGISKVALRNSVEMFSFDQCLEQNSLLHLFIDHYSQASAAYNAANNGEGGCLTPLEQGALPFYAVVQTSDGSMERHNLHWQPTVEKVLEDAALHGKVVAVLGKALILPLDIRRQGPLVLPEKGSPYASQSNRFQQQFQAATGIDLRLHSIYRLRLNALDALANTDYVFILPEYLQEPFGTNAISGRDFARSWRAVADAAEQEAHKLKQLSVLPTDRRVNLLLSQRLIGQRLANTWLSLQDQQVNYAQKVAAIQQDTVDNNASQQTRKSKHQLFTERQSAAAAEYDPHGLKLCLRTMNDLAAARVAVKIRDHLQVAKSLHYWNCRPFTHWVLGIPGWLEGILDIARVEPESMPDEAENEKMAIA